MRTLTSAGATIAAVGITVGLMSAPAYAAPAAPAAPTASAASALTAPHAQAAPRPPKSGKDSIKCSKHSSARVNFSWKNGWETTTLYFNNHCTKGKRITAAIKWAPVDGKPWYECFSTNGKTKGKHKFGHRTRIADINTKTKYCGK